MLPRLGLKKKKAFQILRFFLCFSLLDIFGESGLLCFSRVPMSFLANSGLNHSHFRRDLLQLIFLQRDGDNACRNSPLGISSYYLGRETTAAFKSVPGEGFVSISHIFVCVKKGNT